METEKCQDDLKSLEVKIDSVKKKTKKIFEEKCQSKKIQNEEKFASFSPVRRKIDEDKEYHSLNKVIQMDFKFNKNYNRLKKDKLREVQDLNDKHANKFEKVQVHKQNVREQFTESLENWQKKVKEINKREKKI